MQYELLLKAGRLFCAAAGLDRPGAVLVHAGRIVSCGADVANAARQTLHFPDGVLLPGLVDLHAHPARGGSKYGIDPDRYMLPSGVTTVLSQGDAGALTWEAYREDVIQSCRTRVRMALNLSARGEAMPQGCFSDPADLDVAACVNAVRNGGADIWGISVNVSRFSCGPADPRQVVDAALEVARETGNPLLYGPRQTADWPLEEQLARLRSGDVVTYCFDPARNVLSADGRVRAAAREAQARGILFDVGHGAAAFDYGICRAALADGFVPDTISSDLYGAHLGRLPRHNLPRVISTLIAAGMSEGGAFAAATQKPAAILGLTGETGTLAVGACADLVVLQREPPDATWQAALVVRAGIVHFPQPAFPNA